MKNGKKDKEWQEVRKPHEINTVFNSLPTPSSSSALKDYCSVAT